MPNNKGGEPIYLKEPSLNPSRKSVYHNGQTGKRLYTPPVSLERYV